MNQKIQIVLGILIAGIVTSCGHKEERKIEEAAIHVSVWESALTQTDEQYHFSGVVISDDKTVLSTKVVGQVKNVWVSEGDKVKKGQLLVQIKSKDIESKLASAKASLTEASSAKTNTEKNLKRIQTLQAKGSATQRELDDISSAFTMAKAREESVYQSIAELEELLTYVNLRSPIDGFVSQKFINTGDMATPGAPILALESVDQLKVDIDVPEFEIAMFSENDVVSVRFNAIADKVYQGVVDRIIPSSAYSGAQFKVSLLLTDGDEKVKSGMHAKVNMLSERSNQLQVPEKALYRQGQLVGVYTVSQQDRALLRWLRLGKQSGNNYEVLSGLDAGEKVILSADAKIIDGQKVIVDKQAKL